MKPIKRVSSLALLGSALLACSVETAGSGEAFESEVFEALTAPGESLLLERAAPVRFHQVVAGADDAQYRAAWSRFRDLDYTPVTLSSVQLPDGSIRYSSVFHKLPRGSSWKSLRNMSLARFEAEMTTLSANGYRPLDLEIRGGGSDARYSAIWLKQAAGPIGAAEWGLSVDALRQTLARRERDGYRPTKVRAYTAPNGVEYTAVFVNDGGPQTQVVTDVSRTELSAALADNHRRHFQLVDISVRHDAEQPRYTAVFALETPGVTTIELLDATQASFEQRHTSLTNQGYVLVDVEHYSGAVDVNLPRYSAIWQRSLSDTLDTNLDLQSTNKQLSNDALQAVTDLRNKLSAYPGRVGFVIEDLRNGNYIGYHVNDPTYLASTSKVLIAGAVLRHIETSKDTLDTLLPFEASDALVDDTTGALDPLSTSHVGQSFSIDRYLRWMINQSSTNATDRLVRYIGERALNDFVNATGHVNVGEITAICELDKRVHESINGCVRDVPCTTFERWYRQDQASEDGCLNLLTNVSVSSAFSRYYASLANTATPLEYARFWRRLLNGSLVSNQNRDRLVDILDLTGNGIYDDNIQGRGLYEKMGGKHGSKFRARSYTGLLWDGAGASGAAGDLGEYSLSLFTESWPAGGDTAARELIRDIIGDSVLILKSSR